MSSDIKERIRLLLPSTVGEVVAEVCRQQRLALRTTGELAPLTQKNIAEAMNVDAATVSRALTVIAGLVDLFDSALEGDVPSAVAKEQIAKLIDGEDKARPFSDQEIANLLDSVCGIKASRRTVAKFRQSMGIAGSGARSTTAADMLAETASEVQS